MDDNSIGGLSDLRQLGRGTALGEAARPPRQLARPHVQDAVGIESERVTALELI
ncbi:MAG TPA: hypothetical protein VIM34_17915 [Burkholderiaceae bacterium]